MQISNYSFRRRSLLFAAVGAGLNFHPCFAQTASVSVDPAIGSAALVARNPSGVLLVAIALAGPRLVAVGEHGLIIYSENNGGTWTQARVPVEVTFTSVAFATPKIGWAAGHFGVIVRTGDGGETWQTQLNGLQVNQMTMAAAEVAVAENTRSAGGPLALRRAQNFVTSGPSKPFLSILVLDEQKVIAFGAYRMTVMTTDGGKTWVDWSLHIEDKFSHNLYDAAIVGANVFLVGESGLVFRSNKAGDDFIEATAPGPVTLLGVLGAADGSILAFGVAGNAFRSTDDATTWSPVSFSIADNLVAGRTLASGEILVASMSGSLFKSTDNGESFKLVSDVPPTSIFDFIVSPENNLILVGIAGVLRLPASILNS